MQRMFTRIVKGDTAPVPHVSTASLPVSVLCRPHCCDPDAHRIPSKRSLLHLA